MKVDIAAILIAESQHDKLHLTLEVYAERIALPLVEDADAEITDGRETAGRP